MEKDFFNRGCGVCDLHPFFWAYAAAGEGKMLKGVRTACPIFALVPFGRTMVLWTDRANELAADAEEMGATYSEAMANVTPVWMLIVMLAVTILLAIAAERVTEKVMKKTSSALR